MMSLYSFDIYEPISVSSVPPGWRALYESPGGDPPWYTVPLSGWGVFRLTVHGNSNDGTIEIGKVIEGVIIESGYPVSAVTPNLITYLSPDEPDPELGKAFKVRPRELDRRLVEAASDGSNGRAVRTAQAQPASR